MSHYSLISKITDTLQGLSDPEELTYEELQTNLWALARTHMDAYAALVRSSSATDRGLAYLMENDRRIPEDDIDTDGEWDYLAAIHDAYLESLQAVLRLLVAMSP